MKKEIITHREPKSPISEIFRTLRTNIQFANTKRGLHSLLITSTSPSEGKSWVSANLAVVFAQAGKKVILVDCDMRKGRQFSIFGVAPTPGLSNYLSGINSNGEESNPNILSYIKETEVENLYLIPAGNVPPNPSELLVSEQMEQAVEELKSVCDLVIFDGTPTSLVTDAVIISRYVDTSLIVSAYKQTKMDELEKVKRDIENVGGKIAGVVINKMQVSQKQYYSTYYYGSSSPNMKNVKTEKPTKQDEELEAERKRQELKEKSKNIVKQNREDKSESYSKQEYRTENKPYNKQENRKENNYYNKQEHRENNYYNKQEHRENNYYNKQEHKVENKPYNKEYRQQYNAQETYAPKKESKIYDYEKEDAISNKVDDATALLKQMTKYIDEEKAKLKKGDNQ